MSRLREDQKAAMSRLREDRKAMTSFRKMLHRIGFRSVALVTLAAVLTSCGWQGIANVPLPGGSSSGAKMMTIYVQMPDTLAINVNSRVRVADVFVGSVRTIELKNWVANLTLDVQSDVTLPANALAAIGQTSLLGSQHVQLDPPTDPSPQRLKDGDTIPLSRASAFPTTERVLASIGTILNGGGVANLEVIQTELNNVLTGRADKIRDVIGQLDTFVAGLNEQRNDITRAIDSTDRLLGVIAARNDSLDRVLTEFPPLVKHFADTRDLLANAIEALGRVSAAANDGLGPSRGNLRTNLQNLQRPLKQLVKASPYLVGALSFLLTAPFASKSAAKAFRGDYINVSVNVDLTLSAIDHSIFTGTGISGALRALEQSWGRDPSTMVPDVRFTPNPHDAPGGPLVERGE